MSVKISTPKRSASAGSSVRGATSRTRAPIMDSSRMLERATRLMQHVAADRHDQAFEAAAPAADGERIQQRLGGMFMAPSPALTTLQSSLRDSSSAAPES